MIKKPKPRRAPAAPAHPTNRPGRPARTPPGANPYRQEVADQVPELPASGSPTTGVVDLGNGTVLPPQQSGYAGPSANLPKPRRGMDRNLMAHVEAHAVAAMRQAQVSHATLYINKVPCTYPHPLSGRPWGCEEALPRMLKAGESLTVYGPNGYAKVFHGVP